jgi:serine protease Do
VVFRDGAETVLSVAIGRLEEAVLAAAPGMPGEQEEESSEQVILGMTVATVDEALRARFGITDDARGLVVVSVDEGSDAYAKGMRDSDLITEVGREAIATPREMERRIEAARSAGRKSLLLLVRRGDAPRFVALSLVD